MIDTKYPEMKGGFIHVPFIPQQVVDKAGQPAMSIEDIAKGLTAAVEAIVDYADKEDLKSNWRRDPLIIKEDILSGMKQMSLRRRPDQQACDQVF